MEKRLGVSDEGCRFITKIEQTALHLEYLPSVIDLTSVVTKIG